MGKSNCFVSSASVPDITGQLLKRSPFTVQAIEKLHSPKNYDFIDIKRTTNMKHIFNKGENYL